MKWHEKHKQYALYLGQNGNRTIDGHDWINDGICSSLKQFRAEALFTVMSTFLVDLP